MVAIAVDPGERVDVPIVASASGPRGWSLRQFSGRADVAVVRTEGRVALRLKSDRSSFALYRDVAVDLQVFPVLAWSWKVTRLPAAADVRRAERDDQAAQVYVVFARWPSPLTHRNRVVDLLEISIAMLR